MVKASSREVWWFQDGEQGGPSAAPPAAEGNFLSGAEARIGVTGNIAAGRLTTWFASDRGRSLAVVSNGQRAMVVLMEGEEGDPGEQAFSPDAPGSEEGFVLENGQSDTYDNADTVPLAQAMTHLEALIDTGLWDDRTPWRTNNR